jgi:hypothetical protein
MMISVDLEYDIGSEVYHVDIYRVDTIQKSTVKEVSIDGEGVVVELVHGDHNLYTIYASIFDVYTSLADAVEAAKERLMAKIRNVEVLEKDPKQPF